MSQVVDMAVSIGAPPLISLSAAWESPEAFARVHLVTALKPDPASSGNAGLMYGTSSGAKIMEVTLVRHAGPDPTARESSRLARLGPAGRAIARRLAHALPAGPLMLTSEEPGAVQTAEAIVSVRGGAVRIDERVGEARRPHRWDERFQERARRYVAGQRYAGWEPQEDVARRFDAGVHAALQTRESAPLVVVNHGLALTLWLQSVGAVADVEAFWSSLANPDAWSVGVRPTGATFQAFTLARIPI